MKIYFTNSVDNIDLEASVKEEFMQYINKILGQVTSDVSCVSASNLVNPIIQTLMNKL